MQLLGGKTMMWAKSVLRWLSLFGRWQQNPSAFFTVGFYKLTWWTSKWSSTIEMVALSSPKMARLPQSRYGSRFKKSSEMQMLLTTYPNYDGFEGVASTQHILSFTLGCESLPGSTQPCKQPIAGEPLPKKSRIYWNTQNATSIITAFDKEKFFAFGIKNAQRL